MAEDTAEDIAEDLAEDLAEDCGGAGVQRFIFESRGAPT